MTTTDQERTSRIRRVLLITLLMNLLVSSAKIAYGYFSLSVAIIADGYHSMFDGISNIVGFGGIYLAANPPDEDHPYGHRKYETVFTIFIGVMMFMTCIEIFKKVYEAFTGSQAPVVTSASFAIMLMTMGINIGVAVYENRMGKRLASEFLTADSQHTKSDIYATAGVLIGLIFIKLGFPVADAVVALAVGLLVARTGLRIMKEAAETLVDRRQVDTGMIQDIVCSLDNVVACHKIRTRGTNSSIFLDLHILVNPSLSVEAGHRISHLAEEKIKAAVSGIIDVVVHIEPSGHEEEEPARRCE
ncbi:MAG: cation diffusion facilitator family transporter [Thermodesulfovibrionales bacterium]